MTLWITSLLLLPLASCGGCYSRRLHIAMILTRNKMVAVPHPCHPCRFLWPYT